MSESAALSAVLNKLLAEQQLAVLATEARHAPYTNLVAFVSTPDLREIFFATPRSTRKWSNLQANRQVALLVDNRSNGVKDFAEAMAATAVGEAFEISAEDRPAAEQIYLAKYPHLSEFITNSSCALVRIQVANYHVVSRFKDTQQYRPNG